MKPFPLKFLVLPAIAAGLVLPAALAQPLTLGYAMEATGPEDDGGRDVAMGPNDDSYTVGYFGRRADFQAPGGSIELFSAGESDAFVMRLSREGDPYWVVPVAVGPSAQVAEAVDTGPGGVWVGGAFTEETDFDPGPGESMETTDPAVIAGFAVRLNAAGSLLAFATFGGTTGTEVEIRDVAAASDGGVVVIGTFEGTVDFDPGPGVDARTSTPGFVNTFIVRLDAGGGLLWVAHLSGDGSNRGLNAALGPDDGVVVGGSFNGTADFDPGLAVEARTATSTFDGYILSLDPNGAFRWVNQYVDSSSPLDAVRGLDVDPSGHVFASVGDSIGTVQGVNVYRLASDGSEIWSVLLGVDGFNPAELVVGQNGRVHLFVTFGGTRDFDPGPGVFELTPTVYGHAVVVLESDGEFVTAGFLDGYLANVRGGPYGLAVESGGAVLLTGHFVGDMDFDPGPDVFVISGGGPGDVYLARLLLGDDPTSVLEIPTISSLGLVVLMLFLGCLGMLLLRRRRAIP